jgi:hypothetical protein
MAATDAPDNLPYLLTERINPNGWRVISKRSAGESWKGSEARPEDAVSPEDEIKDPFVLEFLSLRDAAVAHYALEGPPNKVLAAEYRTALPDEEVLAAEVERTRKSLEGHRMM